MLKVEDGQNIRRGDLVTVYYTEDGPVLRHYDANNKTELHSWICVAGEDLRPNRCVWVDMSNLTVVDAGYEDEQR